MNRYPDYNLVQKCLLEIEEKLGWGNADQWHSKVFSELSEKIQAETNILLSPTTLKRVWGKVSYKHAPSINTLNTLSQFAGYTNWRDFKISSSIPKKKKVKTKSISNLGIIMVSAACMTILFISFFSMVDPETNNSNIPPPETITFSSRPITDGLPNSVIFDFDLKNTTTDNIFIQQYWDETKTIRIKPTQKQATGIYYYPGYFRAKLLINEQQIKEHDLFIKTEKWIGTLDYKPIPKYIENLDLRKGLLSFPPAVKEEIKSSPQPLLSSFHFVNDFKGVSGDNFLFKTSIRNTYSDKWAICQNTKIVILGTKGAMIIPFSIPGCVSDIGLMLNDVYVSGKEHDLSAFGLDFFEFRNIEMEVKEKEVSVRVDGKQIYSGAYYRAIGQLVGIRFRFLGIGEVKDLIIKNAEGTTVVDGI